MDDRAYRYGGTDASGSGYERQSGMGPQLLRALAAVRGKWPGGRGRQFGSRLTDVRMPDAEGMARIKRDVEEAWAEFVEAGQISDIAIETETNGDRAVEFFASYYDRTIGETGAAPLPASWER